MTRPPLHLASSSPRRREILQALGLSFSWQGTDVEEAALAGESVRDMVLRLAVAKARAAATSRASTTAMLGADTAVVLSGRVFGKPASRDEALAMLAELSGRTHQVLTGVALVVDDRLETALSVSEVRFRELHPDEAAAYWRSGEPRGKAGAYAIQGRGGVFVESLSGSYSGVAGLPVFETGLLLRGAGIDVLGSRCTHDEEHRP